MARRHEGNEHKVKLFVAWSLHCWLCCFLVQDVLKKKMRQGTLLYEIYLFIEVSLTHEA